MSNKDIWDASTDGDLDRVKYLVEVERVDVNSPHPGIWVINYNIFFIVFYLFYYFRLELQLYILLVILGLILLLSIFSIKEQILTFLEMYL